MNYEIDWLRLANEDVISSIAEAKVKLTEHEMIMLFQGKNAEFGFEFSGRINLQLHCNVQLVYGVFQDKTIGITSQTPYELSGKFVDDSWQQFEGYWIEGGERFQFTAICIDELEEESSVPERLIEENNVIAAQPDSQEETVEREVETVQVGRFTKQHRAARSDARVRAIQRKIELRNGLPRGSVKLCNPDRSIISPLAKIGTLRERWE